MADEEQFDGLDELPSSPSPDTIKGKVYLLPLFINKSFSLYVKKNEIFFAAR